MDELLTEQSLEASATLDTLSIAEMTALMNAEDATVAQAVAQALPQINALIACVVDCVGKGGRVIYIGAGTSGRLGVLDAVECVPTFGVSENLFIGIIAGGERAIYRAVEGAEDSPDLAVADLQALGLNESDVVIGLAASGRTPYVIGGLAYAAQQGAQTGSISCNPNSEMSRYAMFPVEVAVGSEVLSGSTRLKSGTAQKMVLNMISTVTMVQHGKAYRNLMVDVQATNQKLVRRAISIIQQATGCSSETAQAYFESSGRQTKVAIIRILTQTTVEEAEVLLAQHQGFIRRIVDTKNKARKE